MGDVTISMTLVLEILTFIAAAGSAATVIWKVLKPVKDAGDKIEKHEERLDKADGRFEELSEMQKMQCKCTLALIDHEITGNSIDKLKTVKSEMQSFLIEKS